MECDLLPESSLFTASFPLSTQNVVRDDQPIANMAPGYNAILREIAVAGLLARNEGVRHCMLDPAASEEWFKKL